MVNKLFCQGFLENSWDKNRRPIFGRGFAIISIKEVFVRALYFTNVQNINLSTTDTFYTPFLIHLPVH